jgi:SAM-dependent methyltransferase
MLERFHQICEDVRDYYTDKIQTYGAVAQGVDWNSQESQELRFEQLIKICSGDSFSLIDYGCGYGHLLEFISRKKSDITYIGYDLSSEMIAKSATMHSNLTRATFYSDVQQLSPADFTIASGIFNVKLSHSDDLWQDYVIETLKIFDNLSKNGFAFNILTSYSDKEFMRENLYYADPCFYFDFCKRHFSKNIALLHDYGLYEFTILVRK